MIILLYIQRKRELICIIIKKKVFLPPPYDIGLEVKRSGRPASLFNKLCHPERSEGSIEILRLKPQDDRNAIPPYVQTFLPHKFCKAKLAFTLAETLITLVIIGVVAALTIPTMLAKYQEQETITRLESTYSILSQALKMAESHNGKIDTWDIGESSDTAVGALKLYNYIAPEIKKLRECKLETGCFATQYKNLQGTEYQSNPSNHPVYTRGVLNNGVSFLVWSYGSGCNANNSISNSGSLLRVCGSITVDINGEKKPNRAGYDLFSFTITKDGLLPSGIKDQQPQYGHDCSHSTTPSNNGSRCTAWVLYKKNFDYKHKDISWD